MNIPNVSGCSSLAEATRIILLSQEGVHEIGNTNSGPEVDEFNAAVNMPPGTSWCCAYLCWGVKNAAKQLNVTPQFQYGASVFKLWTRNQSLILPGPQADCIMLRNEGISRFSGHAIGHALWVLGVNDDTNLHVISGNTTAADPNARTGGSVAIQNRPQSQMSNGYGYIKLI